MVDTTGSWDRDRDRDRDRVRVRDRVRNRVRVRVSRPRLSSRPGQACTATVRSRWCSSWASRAGTELHEVLGDSGWGAGSNIRVGPMMESGWAGVQAVIYIHTGVQCAVK